jgi:hypothetical protein
VAEIPANPTALGSLVIMPAVIILVSSCANEYTRRAKTSTSDLTVRRLDAMFLQNCLRSCNDFLGENDGSLKIADSLRLSFLIHAGPFSKKN